MPIGNLIRKYRKDTIDEKNNPVSLLELSQEIGWENPSTLSRIETGKVIPSRNTIIKIAQALKLPINDLNMLLKQGGYIEYEPPITDKYIKQLSKSFSEEFESFNYPVFVDLYSWDIVYWNSFTSKFFVTENINEEVLYKKFYFKTLIDFLFDPDYKMRQNVINWEELTTLITGSVLFAQSLFPTDEKLKSNVVNFLKYPEFKVIYSNIKKSEPKYTLFNIPLVYNHPIIGIVNFSITSSFLYFDNRFVVEQIVPVTPQDLEKVNKFLKSLKDK